MLFVVIEIPPYMAFNPFKAQMYDLFDLYINVKRAAKESKTQYIHSDTSQDRAQEQVNLLNSQQSRFLVLEMLLENHYEIARRIESYQRARARAFVESIAYAYFYFGGLEITIPRMEHSPFQATTHTPEPEAQTALRDPFEHLEKPDPALKAEAEKIAEELGDKLPNECIDPVTYEALTEPVEINNRVYNRETFINIMKTSENGMFHDPVTREEADPRTVKSANYMLNAIIAQASVLAGNTPSMLNEYKTSNVWNLKGLADSWEELLKGSAPRP
jgi:hypothetical protein